MSLQWTLVAGFLYAEIVVVLLLMFPFISATIWQKLFKSRFLRSLSDYSNFYFSAFLVILLLLFLDSIRQMQKYGSLRDSESDHGHLDAELQQSMKMFRAQRNCYIAGFALFLAPVIRRLGSLLSRQAELQAREAAAIKQAQSASAAASKLMREQAGDQRESGEGSDEQQKKIKTLTSDLESTIEELKDTQTNLEIVKADLKKVSGEHDLLVTKHKHLKKKYDVEGSDNESKKDE